MPSLESETRALAGLCAECRGKCCRGHLIFISAGEYGRLKKILDFDERKIDSPYGCLKAIDALDRCPFLGEKEGEQGCILNEPDRPLICRLYPINFVLEKKEIRFFLSSLCPYANEVKSLDDWIKKTRKEALKELRENWTRKEISCYGAFFRKDKNRLIEILD